MFVNGWYTKHFLKTAEQLTLCARPMWFSFWWGDEWNIQKQNVSTYYIKNYLYIWYILYINHLFMKIVHDILSVSSYEKATKKKRTLLSLFRPNHFSKSLGLQTKCYSLWHQKYLPYKRSSLDFVPTHWDVHLFVALISPWKQRPWWKKHVAWKPFCLLEGFYENVSLFCLGWTVATMVVLWLLAGLIFK